MNLKKVILLYKMKFKICISNTAYINEFKKSNTFSYQIINEEGEKCD